MRPPSTGIALVGLCEWFARARAAAPQVCPLPSWCEHIIRLRGNGSTPTAGVGAYSEGLGDDLNKVWNRRRRRQLAAGHSTF